MNQADTTTQTTIIDDRYLKDYLLPEEHCEAFKSRESDRFLHEFKDEALPLLKCAKFRIISSNTEMQVLNPLIRINCVALLKIQLNNNVVTAERSEDRKHITWHKMKPMSIIKLAQRCGYKDVSTMVKACFGSEENKTEWSGQIIRFRCSQNYSRSPKYRNLIPQKTFTKTSWLSQLGNSLFQYGRINSI